MDNDDLPIGRILTRREVLALFSATGTAILVGCGPTPAATSTTAPAAVAPTTPPAIPTAAPATQAATIAVPTEAATLVPTSATIATAAPTSPAALAVPACVVKPELTEGPYYVDEELNRADVRSDPSNGSIRPGAPFVLTFNVSQVSGNGCVPLPGSKVEIWHCDAAGQYSDVTDRSFSTKGQQWLRGYQITDANGQASFTTIYPGWYRGRTIHIHFKIHPTTTSVFTSQLFFDDAFSDQVFTQEPYAARGPHDTTNQADNIYAAELLLNVTKTDQGYAASFDIGIQA